jgi:hypothetical protein
MDATGKKARAPRSRGRSVVALYNTVRPHSRIGWQTPAAYAEQFPRQRGQGAALAIGSTPWPLTTEQTEEFNRQTLVATG